MFVWIYLFLLIKAVAGDAANSPVQLADFLRSPVPPKDHLWFLWALAILVAATPLAFFVASFFRGREGWVFLGLALLATPIAHWWSTAVDSPLELWPTRAVRDLPIFLLGVAIGVARLVRPSLALGLLGAGLFLGLQAALLAGLYDYEEWRVAGHLAGFGFLLAIAPLATLAPAAVRDLFCWFGRISMTLYLAHTVFSAFTRIALVKMGVDDLAVHLVAGVLAGLVGPIVMLIVARRLGMAALLGLEGAPRFGALRWGRWART